MKISKTSLAIERHNLKNILVRLKAQDNLVTWLQKEIEHLQRDNHEKVTYQYLFHLCDVNKDTTSFTWNIKAGKKHNKETKFILVLFSQKTYPNYIGWSEPFNII